jgi:hypothetical protein
MSFVRKGHGYLDILAVLDGFGPFIFESAVGALVDVGVHGGEVDGGGWALEDAGEEVAGVVVGVLVPQVVLSGPVAGVVQVDGGQGCSGVGDAAEVVGAVRETAVDPQGGVGWWVPQKLVVVGVGGGQVDNGLIRAGCGRWGADGFGWTRSVRADLLAWRRRVVGVALGPGAGFGWSQREGVGGFVAAVGGVVQEQDEISAARVSGAVGLVDQGGLLAAPGGGALQVGHDLWHLVHGVHETLGDPSQL